MAATEIKPTGSHPDNVTDLLPFRVSSIYQIRKLIAKALDIASHDSRGIEYTDITTSSTDIVGVVPQGAKLTSVKVHQDASDDGTSKTKIDVHKNGSTVLSSDVTLDGSGSATQDGSLKSDGTEDLAVDDVIEVVNGGESDDSSPPNVYVEVTWKYLDNQY